MSHQVNEAVQVKADAFGIPLSFFWERYGQNQYFATEKIVESWQVYTDWWEHTGEIRRAYHCLITRCGTLCVLYENLNTREWFIGKVYD